MTKSKSTASASTVVSGEDSENRKSGLQTIGGSQSDDWNSTLAEQAVLTLWTKNASPEERGRRVDATIAALAGIAPTDEMEGMMAAQLIAAHNAAMECYRRAMIAEQSIDGRNENLAQANKLSRTFAALIDALNRHRGKGQQKVTVEHVHVHAGGRAVVGMVVPPGEPGGGGGGNLEERPLAKQIAHAPEPAMPCSYAEFDAVPVARDGERAVPNARRRRAGRAEGQ